MVGDCSLHAQRSGVASIIRQSVGFAYLLKAASSLSYVKPVL